MQRIHTTKDIMVFSDELIARLLDYQNVLLQSGTGKLTMAGHRSQLEMKEDPLK